MIPAKAIAPLVDLVFPPRCPLCGEGIAAQDGLCATCWNTLAIPGRPACGSCGRPFSDGVTDGATCAPCLGDPPRHDGIAAATLYNDTSRKLVLALKYGNRIALAAMMARLMCARLHPPGDDWLVVPVPLHRWRLWRRGYNQAAILAREVARLQHGSLIVDALIRKRRTPPLGGLDRKARARVMTGAIAVNPSRSTLLAGAKILLVDDVLTSGATSNACVSALKRAGAAKVMITCFARVSDEALVLT